MEELLKKLGYTDEQIKQILDGMAEAKIYTSAEEKIDERYGKLKGDHANVSQQLADATKTIGDLKKANEGNAELQAKIAEYEQRATEAEAKAAKAELESALKVELLANGAVAGDIDYLMYRIEQGEAKPEIKDGKLSGFADVVRDLKTKYPAQFDSKGADGEASGLTVINGKPGKGDDGDGKNEPTSLDGALKQFYEKPNE